MILANFTPDELNVVHGGKHTVLPPGKIIEVEENTGKFVLNKFDRRGLMRLNFGDKPEEKQKEAMETWKTFWKRQIIMYNQDNERRKNTNREYVEPTPELIDHAERLGIALLGPWTIRQTDDAAVRELKDKNTALEAQLAAMMSQMKELADAMKMREVPFELRTAAEKVELTKDAQSASEPDHSELINEFSKLGKERFGEWVMANLDRLQSPDFPPGVYALVKEKWVRLIKSDFPAAN